MAGPDEDVACCSGLDNFTQLHHGDSVGDLRDHRQIMSDKQQAHAGFAGQRDQKLQNLRLRGHIQRGGRFVSDQQTGATGHRHCNHHSLALPAGQFVRIAAGWEPVARQTNALEGFGRASAGVGAAGVAVDAYRFCHLRADRMHWVQGGHRFLKDHADIISAQAAKFGFAEFGEGLASEMDVSRDLGARRQKLHRSQRCHRFAGAAFAGQGENLALGHVQRNTAQDREAVNRDRQVA